MSTLSLTLFFLPGVDVGGVARPAAGAVRVV